MCAGTLVYYFTLSRDVKSLVRVRVRVSDGCEILVLDRGQESESRLLWITLDKHVCVEIVLVQTLRRNVI